MDTAIANLFCKRIEESGHANRWGIGRASNYLRGLGVDEQFVKDAEAKLVYADPKSVIRTGEAIAYEVTDQHIEIGNGKTAQVVRPLRVKAKQPLEGSVMQFTATLTSVAKDRDGDVLDPKGARVDLLGPLLWNHFSGDPIGKMVRIVSQNGKRLVMEFAIADTPLGRDIAQLVEFGALRRMSHGFIPEKYEEMQKDGAFVGWHVHEYEVLEASVVSVASNRDAVITAMSRGKLAHPLVKGWAGKMFDERPVVVQGVEIADAPAKDAEPPIAEEAETSIEEPDTKAEEDAAPDCEEIKGKVPGDPSGGNGEGVEGEWKKPTLADFTDKMWDDCSMMERNAIAKHFAWYGDMEAFGSLKLPHHFPDTGKPSLNGVRNALARANQVEGIGDDMEKVRAHLQAHMPKSADSGKHIRYCEKCSAEMMPGYGFWFEPRTCSTCEPEIAKDYRKLIKLLHDSEHESKSGRTLSKANEASIREAKADCDEIAGLSDLPRAAKALATRASKSLDSVLESAIQPDESEAPKEAKPAVKKSDIAAMVVKAVSGAIRRAKG